MPGSESGLSCERWRAIRRMVLLTRNAVTESHFSRRNTECTCCFLGRKRISLKPGTGGSGMQARVSSTGEGWRGADGEQMVLLRRRQPPFLLPTMPTVRRLWVVAPIPWGCQPCWMNHSPRSGRAGKRRKWKQQFYA
jgi:hypothetical protein